MLTILGLDNLAALEPADIPIPTSVGTTAPTVQVEDDLDEMPTLEPTQQGEPLPPTNTENAAMGADAPPPANQTLAPPPLPPLFTLSDASFPTVPLTGALASEFSHMQQGTGSYTAAELEDMPDMASPAVTPGQASFSNESVSSNDGNCLLIYELTLPLRTGPQKKTTAKSLTSSRTKA